jgi:hypothetical protein
MPAYQTAYINNPISGYPGMIADATDNTILSKRITNRAVGFGLAVSRNGTVAGESRLGGTIYDGITVADKADTEAAYAIDEIAGVMVKGTIWVTASNTVTPADPPTFTLATGVIGAGLGTAIPNARFLTGGTAGQLVQLQLLG